MKSGRFFVGALAGVLLCGAGTLGAQQSLTLDEAVARAGRDIEGKMKSGANLAVLSFDSGSEMFSEYVIEELTGILVTGGKVSVIERRSLDLLRKEAHLQLSGDVDDDVAVSVGKQLGAQGIVTGSLQDTGAAFRFRIKVINVESARIEAQFGCNLRKDERTAFFMSGGQGAGSQPPRTGGSSPAPNPNPAPAPAPSGDAVTFFNRGNDHYKKGDYDRAIADYNEALRINPNYAEAYNNRGLAYYYKKDYDRAIADYNEALRIDSNYANAYNGRGATYSEKKDYDRAIADYSEALRMDPNSARAYNNRGLAYSDKKDYDRAIADYSAALRIDPNHTYAKNNLEAARKARRY
jgi:tetratricopeptide (TPR) repeat protein